MVRQFLRDLVDCGDPEKIKHREHMLWDRGMPGIPQENTPPGAKQECIKACYVMRILRSIEGEIIHMTHPDFSQVQNIGLHDIVSPESMNRIEKNGQIIYRGQVFQKKVDTGYCPLCMYSSQNHQTLNNHVLPSFPLRQCCAEWQTVGTSAIVPRTCGSMWRATVWLPLSPLPKPSTAKRSNMGPYPYCIFLLVLVC